MDQPPPAVDTQHMMKLGAFIDNIREANEWPGMTWVEFRKVLGDMWELGFDAGVDVVLVYPPTGLEEREAPAE